MRTTRLVLSVSALLLLGSTALRADDDASPADETGTPKPPAVAATAVTVVGTRLDTADATSTIRVLTREEISKLPARTVIEALRALPGIDVRRRGVEGIQADVGIRGTDGNGTLVLVDGEPVNDPQTNHFSFDLDVPLDAVERIEVLYGAGAALYGSDAVGGVVNVVTRGAKLGRARGQLEGRYAHGTHSLDAVALRGAMKAGDLVSLSVDADRRESSGFRDDTEFSTKSVRGAARLETGAGPLTLSGGYAGDAFGAYAFYGSRFPDQQETTRVRTARLAGELTFGSWTLMPSISVRAHHDDFVLDRENPAFYENIHDSVRSTARLFARSPLLGGTVVAGVEAGRDTIGSTNLGDHRRDHAALFAEWGRPFDAADPGAGSFRVGLRGDRYDDFGSRLSPHAGLSVRVARAVVLRASVNTAFRVPTFTDLYYRDPQNQGNPDLKAETAVNVEAGASFALGPVRLDAVWFHRDAKNLIDYVRLAPAEPYQARNVRAVTTDGIEATADLETARLRAPWLSRLALQATYVFSDLAALSAAAGGATDGRYVLDPLHVKWDLIAGARLPFRTSLSSRLSYVSRPSFADGAWLLEARAGYEVFEGDVLEVYAEGENLLGTSYQERPGVPLPGRTLLLGARVTW